MTSSYIGELGPFRKRDRSAFLNFLLSKYEMYTGRTKVRSYPYYLTLEPSDVCQLRCPTCVTGIENESRRHKSGRILTSRSNRGMLSLELFDALMEELGQYLFLLVFYNFGEPLLNKNLAALIRKATALDIETDINTNLSLPLSDERIEDLLTSGLSYIYVSIDGFSQETYQIHRVGGNIELVKKNLERLVEARDRLGLRTSITYQFLVFSFNEHEVPAARAYCDDLGINFNVKNAFIHNPDWLPSYRKGEKPWAVPEDVALPHEFSHIVNGQALAWTPLPKIESRFPGGCSWHFGYSAISARGSVSPCCAVPHEKNDFGTVEPGLTRFADVWNNDRYRRSRAAFAGKGIEGLDQLETVCTRCPVSELVHHLYSLHDLKVLAQARNVFNDGSDPLLRQALDLLCTSYFGKGIDALFGAPFSFEPLQPLMFEARETNTACFVDFFEKNLIDEFLSQPRKEA